MDYFLTRDVTGLDIWRMTCPGYVIHVKRVHGIIGDLVPHVVGRDISVLIINPYVIECRKDLDELEDLAAIECLSVPWGTKTLNRRIDESAETVKLLCQFTI